MNRWGLSLGVSPREPLERVASTAAAAEEHGFEALWYIDFQLGMKDVHAAMLLAGQATRRVQIGPGVTNVSTRHLTVTANAITALDEITDGRALLGLGAGWSAVLAAGRQPSRLAEIGTAIDQLRALWSGSEVVLHDRPVRLATARRQIPIYLAASQPGMLRLSGEKADGVILMGAADPAFCRWQLELINEGLARGGRPRSALTIDLMVTLSVANDRAQALDEVRAWATSQAATFHPWKRMPPGWERFREEFARAAEAYQLVDHLSLHAEHRGVVSDEFVGSVAIAGDADTVVGRLRELASLDVDRITLALLSGGRMRRMEQLAGEIVPHVGNVGAVPE